MRGAAGLPPLAAVLCDVFSSGVFSRKASFAKSFASSKGSEEEGSDFRRLRNVFPMEEVVVKYASAGCGSCKGAAALLLIVVLLYTCISGDACPPLASLRVSCLRTGVSERLRTGVSEASKGFCVSEARRKFPLLRGSGSVGAATAIISGVSLSLSGRKMMRKMLLLNEIICIVYSPVERIPLEINVRY